LSQPIIVYTDSSQVLTASCNYHRYYTRLHHDG